MSSFRPRMKIPDTWAQIGACPICDQRTLTVTHKGDKPDQLTCTSCQVSFEMETDGPNIRLMTLPPKFAAFIQPAWQTWMTPHEIRKQIKQVHETQQTAQPVLSEEKAIRTLNAYLAEPKSPEPSLFYDELPLEPLTQEEISKRAAGLANLGNSENDIRETLQRFNATPEQINHAIEFISAQKKIKKSNTPRVIIFVLLGLIICLGAAYLILPILNIPKYLDAIRPIWNTLRNSFSGSDIYEGVTGPYPTITPSVTPQSNTTLDDAWSASYYSFTINEFLSQTG